MVGRYSESSVKSWFKDTENVGFFVIELDSRVHSGGVRIQLTIWCYFSHPEEISLVFFWLHMLNMSLHSFLVSAEEMAERSDERSSLNCIFVPFV